jgi:hypothetical protein
MSEFTILLKAKTSKYFLEYCYYGLPHDGLCEIPEVRQFSATFPVSDPYEHQVHHGSPNGWASVVSFRARSAEPAWLCFDRTGAGQVVALPTGECQQRQCECSAHGVMVDAPGQNDVELYDVGQEPEDVLESRESAPASSTATRMPRSRRSARTLHSSS